MLPFNKFNNIMDKIFECYETQKIFELKALSFQHLMLIILKEKIKHQNCWLEENYLKQESYLHKFIQNLLYHAIGEALKKEQDLPDSSKSKSKIFFFHSIPTTYQYTLVLEDNSQLDHLFDIESEDIIESIVEIGDSLWEESKKQHLDRALNITKPILETTMRAHRLRARIYIRLTLLFSNYEVNSIEKMLFKLKSSKDDKERLFLKVIKKFGLTVLKKLKPLIGDEKHEKIKKLL